MGWARRFGYGAREREFPRFGGRGDLPGFGGVGFLASGGARVASEIDSCCPRNNRQPWLVNGMLGTVEHVSERGDGLSLRLDQESRGALRVAVPTW